MQEKSFDFGSVHIHKKVIVDIINTVTKRIDGVHLVAKFWPDKLLGFLGKQRFPGILIEIDEQQQVSLDVNIALSYGMNILETATSIQDSIKAEIEKTTNISIHVININIQGLVREERK